MYEPSYNLKILYTLSLLFYMFILLYVFVFVFNIYIYNVFVVDLDRIILSEAY